MMTMTIDNQQRFGGMNFDHMSYNHTPQFTNPWTSTAGPSQSHHVYATPHNLKLDGLPQPAPPPPQQHQVPRMNSSMPIASYASVPITTASAGSPLLAETYASQDLLTMPQDLMSSTRTMSSSYGHDIPYTSAPSPVHTSYAPSASPYESMGYTQAPVRSTYALPTTHEQARRLSHPSVPSPSYDLAHDAGMPRQSSFIDMSVRGLPHESTRSFGDAIDASRGMIAMSQHTTPRNIYGSQGRSRGSGDSYGFPTTHSTSSSISSTGTYPSYFSGSVDSSVSDYSNAGSDIESVSSRTLPRPSGLLNGSLPPAPATMMGSFNSKVSVSTQKKHKCKVCDKRFTRPSSLQTHMYSHTGEKPFSCEVEGCGRQFSVVSNLRRHRKVHKGEALSDVGSEDHHTDD